MRATILAILMTSLVAACSSSPKVVSGTQQNVLIAYDGTDVTEAEHSATAYCNALGKQAVLQGATQEEKRSVATFSCN